MAHKDIISKDLLKRLVLDMSEHLFGRPLSDAEILNEEHQRIEDRRADLVVRAVASDGERFLLHIEIQNGNDPAMPLRMMRYYTDIALAHPGESIRQYLIYIGGGAMRMDAAVGNGLFEYRYTLIDTRKLDCQRFLAQDNPDALIFAILCDFKGRDGEEMVTYILERLQALCGDQPKRHREYLVMLDMLAANRNLQSVIKEAEPMLRMRIEELATYEMGMEKGVEKGLREGRAAGRQEGREAGREEGQAVMVRRLLARFGEREVAELTGLDAETVRRLGGGSRH